MTAPPLATDIDIQVCIHTTSYSYLTGQYQKLEVEVGTSYPIIQPGVDVCIYELTSSSTFNLSQRRSRSRAGRCK